MVATGALFGSAGIAQESRARTDVQWIQAVRQAAQRVNYQGTVVYQAAARCGRRGSRICSTGRTRMSASRRSMASRANTFAAALVASDQVQCLIPETRRIVVEHRNVDESFPGLSSAVPGRDS